MPGYLSPRDETDSRPSEPIDTIKSVPFLSILDNFANQIGPQNSQHGRSLAQLRRLTVAESV